MDERKDERRNPDEEKAIEDANRDPLSGRAGAHPVGTGVGAALGGAAAGAAAGMVGGPVGTVVGAAVGGVIGGLAGKGIAESVDPTVEHGFWRESYPTRPYALPGTTYDEYAPAYQYGWESQQRYQGKSFDEAESSLRQDWEKAKGKSSLTWDRARDAVRDSWDRMARRRSGTEAGASSTGGRTMGAGGGTFSQGTSGPGAGSTQNLSNQPRSTTNPGQCQPGKDADTGGCCGGNI